MKILADTKTVSIENEEKLTSGALNSDTLEVELSKEYEGLTTFVTFNETEIMVVGNMVDVPTLKSGTCRIGVYAVDTVDDETVLRYSPTPATIFVSSGTFNENLHIDPPTQSEADRIYSLINKAIEEGKLKGDKGDRGDVGEQGPKGDTGEQGPKGENGKDGRDGVDGKNGLDGKDGLNGIDGINGKDGRDGIDGKDGVDGKDGRDGKDFEVAINTDSSTQLQLSNNTEYRRGTIENLSISLGENIESDFYSVVVFSSGSTATNFVCNEAIKWVGTDVKDNIFIPVANKTYELHFWFNGTNINCISWGV